MGNLNPFGEKKTVKQIIREQKYDNKRSIRQLERELNKIKREEKKNQIEMKRLAKQGQNQSVRVLAKDIVRMRQTQANFIKMKCELTSLSHQLDTVQANKQLMDSMKNISNIMPMINNQIKLPELQTVIRKFDEEHMKSEIKQEMMDDMMDSALDHDSDAEDELIDKVMAEIGIEIDSNLQNVPNKQLKDKQDEIANENEDKADKDLQNRLDALMQ
eukprot:CAMPEP_0201571250 /NCGR_PEP_ID=MMETSP0190_2-20130828/13929_1 /ASSEMBLY_ACC=CAM_ASM_000263 /TAXON_ID=37353 /ORGANISM="Rosalina sp." /LENGTH=215 /DNA_ID=CAMNT_0047995691 /DNA_START=18 /DNA_END=665 /DNA_ORIENTATION=-